MDQRREVQTGAAPPEKRRVRARARGKRSARRGETRGSKFPSSSPLCAPVTPPSRRWRVSDSQITIVSARIKSRWKLQRKALRNFARGRGTTAALVVHASQEVTHSNLKLRYVPLAFATRSEMVAFFFAKNLRASRGTAFERTSPWVTKSPPVQGN